MRQEEIEILLKRVIVAAIFIPILILFILWGGFAFSGLVCVIIGCGLFELYRGMKRESLYVNIYILSGIFISTSFHFMGEKSALPILTLIIYLIFFVQFFEFKAHSNSINAFINIGGILYISFLFSHILILRNIPERGVGLTLTILFTTWMGDTGAYFVGERWGRHKFLPEISPHKSVEGFLGGILVSLLAMFICRAWLSLPLIHTLILGIAIGTVGQMGDFFESMLKREMGIKDFGRVLPGHGGVLDRFDSLLFTVPLFYYYVKYLIIF